MASECASSSPSSCGRQMLLCGGSRLSSSFEERPSDSRVCPGALAACSKRVLAAFTLPCVLMTPPLPMCDVGR
eukprot:1255290-Pyramimonas_sp.AAC.1